MRPISIGLASHHAVDHFVDRPISTGCNNAVVTLSRGLTGKLSCVPGSFCKNQIEIQAVGFQFRINFGGHPTSVSAGCGRIKDNQVTHQEFPFHLCLQLITPLAVKCFDLSQTGGWFAQEFRRLNEKLLCYYNEHMFYSVSGEESARNAGG
jgi:hypothetical protein